MWGHNSDRHHTSEDSSNSNFHPMRIRRKVSTRSRRLAYQPYITKCVAACLLIGFVGFHLRYTSLKQQQQNNSNRGEGPLRTIHAREQWVTPQSLPFNDHGVASQARNLILVAGHSVTTSGHLEDADHDEADWFLLDYQKQRGLPQAIMGHIRAGIDAAKADPTSLLIFSGGETRPASGPDTEGASYFRVADAMNVWTSNVRARTLAEEFATDSFQNLLYSICRFHEVTGRYPDKITVVSFTFKERRFATMHAKALRWPPAKFSYIGMDPSPTDGFNLEEASIGEMENAAKPFEEDPYGCNSPILREKRKGRNPFFRTPSYELSCPGMKELLDYCGPDLIDETKVPWKTR